MRLSDDLLARVRVNVAALRFEILSELYETGKDLLTVNLRLPTGARAPIRFTGREMRMNDPRDWDRLIQTKIGDAWKEAQDRVDG